MHILLSRNSRFLPLSLSTPSRTFSLCLVEAALCQFLSADVCLKAQLFRFAEFLLLSPPFPPVVSFIFLPLSFSAFISMSILLCTVITCFIRFYFRLEKGPFSVGPPRDHFSFLFFSICCFVLGVVIFSFPPSPGRFLLPIILSFAPR